MTNSFGDWGQEKAPHGGGGGDFSFKIFLLFFVGGIPGFDLKSCKVRYLHFWNQ